MESNKRRYPEDDNQRYNNSRRNNDVPRHNDNPRNLEENQRIGRDIARERGNQNWNEQYRSGQSYHNQNEGFGPGQTHYGARQNSAYRNPDINYGNRANQNNPDRFDQRNNQRFERNNQQSERYNQNQDNNGFSNQNRNPNTNYHEQSPGERHYDRERDTWPERNEYKDDDYRFRSGNRGNWHAPDGLGNPDNDRNQRNYRDQNNYRNYNQDYDQSNYRNQNQDRYWNDNRNRNENQDQDRDQGFFGRIGNSISNTWNNLTNPDDYNQANEGRNYGAQNRHAPRGYEPGPRWADDSETDHRARENKDFRADLE